MTPTGLRWRRLRDLLLLVAASIFTALFAFLLAGWIWYRPIFQTFTEGRTLLLAAIMALIACLAGGAFVLAPPPCQGLPRGRIKGSPSPVEGRAPDQEGQS